MRWKLFVRTIVILWGMVSSFGLARQAQPAKAGGPAAPKPVQVPEGNGVPVITDGIFSPGEWEDALRIPLNESVELYLKHYRGVVFIGICGVRGRGDSAIGPSDLFLAEGGGPVHQLHRSAQLGEIVLPAAGEAPSFRFGLTPDWYANEERRDQVIFDRMRKEGKSPLEVLKAANFPSDGIEFAIRRSKFPGPVWRLRATISGIIDGRPGMITWPAGTADRDTAGWLELQLK
jgi:hypothetical protein